MSSWIAVSFGALDVRSHPVWGGDFRYLIAPIHPGIPVALFGEGASVWERIVKGPVPSDEFDAEQLVVLQEMEEMGIAARRVDHPARVREVNAPWLSSPIHEMVYSILGRVADQEGVAAVFIKGPTLHAQGLREREHSGDVDCWVEPGAEERFARAMKPWGWRPAFSAFTGTPVLHSLTLRAPEWACAVDVHGWFPGMTVSPADAFDQLLRSAENRTFAGYVAKTPERSMHAVISALHDVRPVGGRTASPHLVATATETLSRAGESAAGVAVRTGAEHALKEPLSNALPGVAIDYDRARVPVDWPWRLQPTTLGAYRAALRILPLSDRVRAIYRVVWPKAESLMAGPTAEGSAGANVAELRAKRAKQGMRHLIVALRRRP